jgi:mannosidase alpha-like ER degradation enhancer 2
VLGGYYLTLVDSLSTLAVMDERHRFSDAMDALRNISFDRDVDVSVFEANIRVLGGLLSAHQLSVFLNHSQQYDGWLLLRCEDLAQRLLAAFDTPTGVPVHNVNLQRGKLKHAATETCPAAGATFLLEMGTLSRLTGKKEYERAAQRAMKAIWARRSSRNLIGAMFDTNTGAWTHTHASIGAGADSFYEYMIKGYLLFGDAELLNMSLLAYEAVEKHTKWGLYNIEVLHVHVHV